MRKDAVTAKNFLFRELMCALILGSLPCTLVVLKGGVESLLDFIKGLNPPEIITWFFACLVIGHIVVWSLNYFWIKPNDTIDSIFGKVYHISDQVGFSLMAIYRAIAGALFVVTPAIVTVEPSTNNKAMLVIGYFFAFACIWVCCNLSLVQSKTTARIRGNL